MSFPWSIHAQVFDACAVRHNLFIYLLIAGVILLVFAILWFWFSFCFFCFVFLWKFILTCEIRIHWTYPKRIDSKIWTNLKTTTEIILYLCEVKILIEPRRLRWILQILEVIECTIFYLPLFLMKTAVFYYI